MPGSPTGEGLKTFAKGIYSYFNKTKTNSTSALKKQVHENKLGKF